MPEETREFSYSFYWDNKQIKISHEVFHVRNARYNDLYLYFPHE